MCLCEGECGREYVVTDEMRKWDGVEERRMMCEGEQGQGVRGPNRCGT